MSLEFESLAFDLPKNQSNTIKVIGVGGGGSNAVNHMFRKGVDGIDFVVCNTDAQALQNSPIPTKIQLGATLTEGLGAGANPEIGEQAAIESEEEIKKMLGTNAKMVFITVGMGGGTGTGAAPIIAEIAKKMDLLTVGIVTIPFSFEGKMRNEQAQKGIDKLRKHIDSLVVINNNKLREVYGNLGFKAGFSKADEVLSTAAMGIAEVITHHYTQNIDLKDAKTVLSNSGTALMGSAIATGQNRAQEAITKALDSPLLNDNKIVGARNVLLLIVSGSSEITIDEIGEINDYIQSEAKSNVDIIMGVGDDQELGESIAVTIVATGFNKEQQLDITHTEEKKIIHALETETFLTERVKEAKVDENVVRHILDLENNSPEIKQSKNEVVSTTEFIKEIDVVYDTIDLKDKEEESLDEFVITPIAQVEEVDETYEEENQITLTFDLPLTSTNKIEVQEEVIKHSLTASEVRDLEVVDPVMIQPTVTVDGKIRHGLEDFMIEDVKKDVKTNVVEIDKELKFNVRVETKTEANDKLKNEEKESPLNLTIEELQSRADERRQKMKDFNYRFANRPSNIDDYESQPAYKRMGVDLDDVELSSETTENKSRISLSSDDNNDIQLRSNNSFLHDNVD